jgi:hypothetical protein
LQLFRREPGGHHFVDQRERDAPVRTDPGVRGHLLVSPVHDPQQVVGAYDVVSRHGDIRRTHHRRGAAADVAGGACVGGVLDWANTGHSHAIEITQTRVPNNAKASPIFFERQLAVMFPQEVQKAFVFARFHVEEAATIL